jgi:hypothetical protein
VDATEPQAKAGNFSSLVPARLDSADASTNAWDSPPRPRASRIISGNECVDEVPPLGQVILPAWYPVWEVPEESHCAAPPPAGTPNHGSTPPGTRSGAR